VVVEERGHRLIFELGDGGVGPVEDREPCDVGQGHNAARVGLTGHADGYGPLIGEPELLDVAGGAGAFAIRGQAQVIKEIAAQLNLGGQHGIVGRDRWRVESSGEVPLEPVARLVGQCGKGAEGKEQEDAGDPRAFAG